MCAVLDRGHAADDLAVAQGEKELAVRRLVEWIGLDVERIVNGDAQRRYPFGMFMPVVDLPGKTDESAQVARGAYRNDFDGHECQCN